MYATGLRLPSGCRVITFSSRSVYVRECGSCCLPSGTNACNGGVVYVLWVELSVMLLLLQINIHILGTESHTLDLIGNKFKIPVLSSFVSLWISLFSHSPKTKALWKRIHRKSMASFSKTRWWSWWEVMHQIMVQFGDVMPFLTNADLGSSVTRSNSVQNTQQH